MEQSKITTERYLKTIYLLRKYGEVRGARIAEKLNCTKPTVSVALKNLQEKGYVDIQPDHTVELTLAGEKIAVAVLEKHTIFEKLLITLGIDRKTAHQDACEMEHTVSAKSFRALKKAIEDMINKDESHRTSKEGKEND